MLDVKEVATHLKLTPKAVYIWAENFLHKRPGEQLPCYKLGGVLRFDETELTEWKKNHRG